MSMTKCEKENFKKRIDWYRKKRQIVLWSLDEDERKMVVSHGGEVTPWVYKFKVRDVHGKHIHCQTLLREIRNHKKSDVVYLHLNSKELDAIIEAGIDFEVAKYKIIL